ncbi:hypothetical protein QJS66_04240 [Kocuria rhizophila]|nr:hypothetical protein QJS66_04240 [Kocuria rhizophila]
MVSTWGIDFTGGSEFTVSGVENRTPSWERAGWRTRRARRRPP